MAATLVIDSNINYNVVQHEKSSTIEDVYQNKMARKQKHILCTLQGNGYKNTYYYYSGNGKDLKEILDKQERYDRYGHYEYPQPFDIYDIDGKAYSDWNIFSFEKKEHMYDYILQCILNNLDYNYYNYITIEDMRNLEPDRTSDVYHISQLMTMELLKLEFIRDNEEFVSYIYQLLSIHRHKTLYYELIEKALHPKWVGLWLADHLANGKDICDFEP